MLWSFNLYSLVPQGSRVSEAYEAKFSNTPGVHRTSGVLTGKDTQV